MPTTSDPGLVLLVDDEPPIRRLLRTLFEMAGWRVAEAETAGAALYAVAVRRPELVVLDLGLPDISGATCCAGCANGPRRRSSSCR